MIKKAKYTEIDEIHDVAELLRLVEEVHATGQPHVLGRNHEELAQIAPVKSTIRPRAKRKGQPTSEDDPLWDIVGMAHSGGPGDVADNVDKYLAEAHLPPNP